MALRSVTETFRALSAKGRRFNVVFTSDSRYLIDGLTEWVHGWAARGWRRKGGEIENLALWREAVELARPHRCAWRWVRGHAGHPQNEYANHLATRAAASQTASGGLVESRFDEWRAEHLAVGTPDPFPDPVTFRAARSLPISAAPLLP
jgi:ribonuclease HI